MKLNENYIKSNVAGVSCVIPVGEAAQQMHGMIKLNATADAIWDLLAAGRSEDEIVAALTAQFNAPADVLREDVAAFIGRLRDLHILED